VFSQVKWFAVCFGRDFKIFRVKRNDLHFLENGGKGFIMMNLV
jgi:hypothetical protein